ncbi:MAG: alpha/beta hydrolase [Gemmatimonadetes bacterium]|nr:alpha/beta hydrolase [Gemmatimonadota bacterium]
MSRLLLALLLASALLPACGGVRPREAAAPADTLLPLNGTRLFVHREGAGDAIIVVHGGPLLDHGYLVEPLRPLAGDHQLVFYDQRLSGRSDGRVDSASVTLDAFVADLEALRRALGLDRIHLLAHSWGGLPAMKYALAYPDRLLSLVLVSPMAPSAELRQREAAALRATIEPADTAGLGALRASAGFAAGDPATIERMLQLSFRSQLHDPGLAEGLRFHIPEDYRERGRQLGRLMGELGSYDLLAELAELRVPTLVLYGASEVGVSLGGNAFRSTIPDVTLEVLPGAGHFAFRERPAAFLRLTRAFLKEAAPSRKP